MQMGFGLYQEQTQKLVMTPELRQAITILQYSAQDLLGYLQQQMNENPLLEMSGGAEIASRQDIVDVPPPGDPRKEHPEIDWEEYFRNRFTGESVSTYRSDESGFQILDHLSSPGKTLEQHLTEQLGLVKGLSPETKKIVKYLIGNLDEKGYLDVELEDIARWLGCSRQAVEEALRTLQTFDPPGVGARDLKECLLLQLRQAEVCDPVVERIIADHLTDLAENRFQRIADALRVTVQEIQAAADMIRTLNPRPGAAFYTHPPRFIVPEVFVEKVEGEYVVLVNENATPKLTINPYYKRLLSEKRQENRQVTEYIHKKMNSALWLVRSIEQRRMTIYKVTQAIVELQRDFFDKGVSYLRPMTLKEVAERVGLAESTISRATNNKYVQTPRGLFELKYFFTTGLTTESGNLASAESVKKRLKELVDGEDKKRPLSDQKIAELLKKDGIIISRRTVAKYREELGILSSAKRKRY
ncbi:RNA polymerase factor sigma-54 [Bacillaceae bacterium]